MLGLGGFVRGAAAADKPCFIAFVHGSGENYSDAPLNDDEADDLAQCPNSWMKHSCPSASTDWLAVGEWPPPNGEPARPLPWAQQRCDKEKPENFDWTDNTDPRVTFKNGLENFWNPAFSDAQINAVAISLAKQKQGSWLKEWTSSNNITSKQLCNFYYNRTTQRTERRCTTSYSGGLGNAWFSLPGNTAVDATGRSCTVFRVGYNGWRPWYDRTAAGVAARRLASYLDAYNVPDASLLIVTHSMGGLVARYILNNGEPQSMFPDANFQRVSRATSHVITIAAPHGGTTASDALFGEAKLPFANATAAAVIALHLDGDRCAERRSWSLRTKAMRDAIDMRIMQNYWPNSTISIHDRGRGKPIFTIAGRGTREPSGFGFTADSSVDLSAQGNCWHRGLVNGGGGLCYCGYGAGGKIACTAGTVVGAVVGGGAGSALGPLGTAVGTLLGGLVGAAAATAPLSKDFQGSDLFDGLVETVSAHGEWPPDHTSRVDARYRPVYTNDQPLTGPHRQYATCRMNHHESRYGLWYAECNDHFDTDRLNAAGPPQPVVTYAARTFNLINAAPKLLAPPDRCPPHQRKTEIDCQPCPSGMIADPDNGGTSCIACDVVCDGCTPVPEVNACERDPGDFSPCTPMLTEWRDGQCVRDAQHECKCISIADCNSRYTEPHGYDGVNKCKVGYPAPDPEMIP